MKSKESSQEAANQKELFVRIYTRDPLLRVLLDKWKATPLAVWLSLITLGLFDVFVLAPLAGHFYTKGNVLGAIEDIEYLITFLVGIPVWWLIYAWMPRSISRVFQKFKEGHIIKEKCEGDYQKFIQEVEDGFNKPWWIVTAVVLAIAVQILIFLINLQQEPSWNFLLTWRLFVFKIPLTTVTYYTLSMTVIRAILMVSWLQKLTHRFEITIHPLHPDGAGGLWFLGNYSLNLTYMIAMSGVLIAMTMYRPILRPGEGKVQLTPPILLAIFLYVTIAPLCFFAPLWATHSAMRAAKQKRLSEIANHFLTQYGKAYNQMDKVSIKQSLDKIDELKVLYEHTQAFPEWPFDVSILSKFGISWGSMTILPLLSRVGGRLTSILSSFFTP